MKRNEVIEFLKAGGKIHWWEWKGHPHYRAVDGKASPVLPKTIDWLREQNLVTVHSISSFEGYINWQME